MRIRLEKVGPYTCLPLPGPAAETEGFGVGEEVEVVWDESRGQIVVRSIGREVQAPTEVVMDISQSVEEFIAQYSEALGELASL